MSDKMLINSDSKTLSRILENLSELSNNNFSLDTKLISESVFALAEFPKSEIIKENCNKILNYLANQIINQVKSRHFNIIEEIFYYTHRLKHSISNAQTSDNENFVFYEFCSYKL